MRRMRAVAVAGALVASLSPLASAKGEAPTIDVTTVEELYAAVGDPANRDVTVRLAPGTYTLSAMGPAGPRPHGGALRLQRGMTLAGSERRVDTDGDGVPDPVSLSFPLEFALAGTATVIDGSGLAAVVRLRADCAGATRALPDPILHLGHRTVLTGLTIVAGSNVGVGEPAALLEPDQSLEATIAETVVRSSSIAVTFDNSGCAARGARSRFTLTQSVLSGAANALILENHLTGDAGDTTADGPVLSAVVEFNRFTSSGNGMALRAGNLGSDGATLSVKSVGNVFSGNRGNIFALGALGNVVLPAAGNQLRLESHFDVFGATAVFPSVFVSGGNGAGTAGPPVGNDVDVRIIGARFVRDSAASPAEIAVFGSQRGTDNHVELLLRKASVRTTAGSHTMGMLTVQDEVVPGVPPSTARLLGSPQAFVQANQGFVAPDAAYFGPEP